MSQPISQWIVDYLCRLTEEGCSICTVQRRKRLLSHFEAFVGNQSIPAHEAFRQEFLDLFLDQCPVGRLKGVLAGFTDHLEKEGILVLQRPATPELLPLFASYLHYHRRTREVSPKRRRKTLSVVTDLNTFLDGEHVRIEDLSIEDVDRFLREYNRGLAPKTCQDNRSVVRGLLLYLHHEERLFKKDLSMLLKSAPVFNRDNPPKYLRPDELRRLFDQQALFSSGDLRTHAMVRLAYTTGLRPGEVAGISLDDISFKEEELRVPVRKGGNPLSFPLPEETIKAMAAYIIGARPESDERALFLGLEPPFAPVDSRVVRKSIADLMKRAGLPGTPYWLRHTYAQNLLESGASLFEIKEMLGHDSIKSTKRYLHVHMRLMREVLIDD